MKRVYFFCIIVLTSVCSVKAITVGGGIGADIKVEISRAEASEAQPDRDIGKSFDGTQSTWYFSNWEHTTFPVTLTYYFDDAEQIDYLVYHPRNHKDNNGHFMEFELWLSDENEQTEFVKYGDYDFKGSGLPSKISFPEGLKAPMAVRFVVKSGKNNFVTCAEMCFYKKNTQTIIPPVFTDKSCSELLPHIDNEIVQSIENEFYRRLATSLLKGKYETKYRVWEIKPNYLNGFNCRSISVKKGDEVIVFVENTADGNMLLSLGDIYLLNEGPNRFVAGHSGLLCPRYITDNSNAKPAIIHFATGKIEKRHFRQLDRGRRASEKISEVKAEKALKKAEEDAIEIAWSQTLTPKQMKEDIDFFFKFVSKVHVNQYAFVSKDSMKIRKKELYKKCSKPMTIKEFHLQITQLNGMFDEHTGIPYDFSQYVSAEIVFPREIKVTGNQLFIENDDAYDRVLFINGLCVDDLFSVLTNIFHQQSRNPRSQDLELAVTFPALLYHITDARSPFTLLVETAEGEEIEYVVEGTPGKDIDAMQTIFPHILRDFRIYPADSIAVIYYNSSFMDDDLSNWVDSVFQKISDEGVQHLFVDISRNGGGGDLANQIIYNKIKHDGLSITSNIELRVSRYFIESEIDSQFNPFIERLLVRLKYGWKIKANHVDPFPSSPGGYAGNLYIIQGPQTFSAAVDMAARFKYSGVGIVIGEETGGPSASFSNILRNRLPNSKIRFRCATNYVEHPDGKPNRGLLPDIPVELDYSKKYYELEDLKRFLEIIKAVNN